MKVRPTCWLSGGNSPPEKRLSELLTDVGAVDCKVDLLLSKHEDLQDRADAIRAACKRDRWVT